MNFNFEIKYIQYINEFGSIVKDLPDISFDKNLMLSFYKGMQMTRIFDRKAILLQRQGKLGTFPSSLGQEAIFVGAGISLEKNDVYVPNYRDHGALFQRGVTPEEIFLYWGGNEQGSFYKNNIYDFPISIPIGTQLLHAAGAAYAIKYKNEKKVVLSCCGDGGTSKSDFYDAINAAEIWNLPLVILINNNQWAISMSRFKQTKAETLAQKGIAVGIRSIQIDGNDPIAVLSTVSKALNKARLGKGATLIEAVSYRLGDHTTADDASRYVSSIELEKAWKKDPISRFRKYLMNEGFLLEKDESLMLEECKSEIEKESKKYLKIPVQKYESMFNYLYESLPQSLIEQSKDLNE